MKEEPIDDQQRIRSIFLERQLTYSLEQVSRLTGIVYGDLERAVEEGKIEARSTCSGGYVIDWPALAALAFDRWPQHLIERVLGRRAKVLPRLARLRTARFRLPEYQLRLLEVLAAEQSTDASTFLERHLLDLASSIDPHVIEEWIPGYGVALMLFGAD